MAEQDQQDAQGVSFVRIVGQLNRGRMTAELDSALSELVQLVQAFQQKGELTVKVCVKPGKTPESPAGFTTDIVLKRPRPPRAEERFYVRDDGTLSDRQPKQQDLPFERVKREDDEPASEPVSEAG